MINLNIEYDLIKFQDLYLQILFWNFINFYKLKSILSALKYIFKHCFQNKINMANLLAYKVLSFILYLMILKFNFIYYLK